MTTHTCTTNSDSDFNPVSRCCGIEAGDDTPLTVCTRCNKLTAWECADCGATEWTPKELRTQSAEPKPGDTLEDATCTECLTEDVTVTYQRTESWGDSNAPVGRVEFWLCGTCASSDDRT
jgi:hypothetical protein